jgi:hypothetical protein
VAKQSAVSTAAATTRVVAGDLTSARSRLNIAASDKARKTGSDHAQLPTAMSGGAVASAAAPINRTASDRT